MAEPFKNTYGRIEVETSEQPPWVRVVVGTADTVVDLILQPHEARDLGEALMRHADDMRLTLVRAQ